MRRPGSRPRGRSLPDRLRLAWRALPGDLMGLLVMRACGGLRVTRRVDIDGVQALLVEDPRAGRYLDHVPLRPFAQTLGRIVLAREPIPDATVRHEVQHVRQWQVLGPLFLALYGLESLRATLAGGHRYRDNGFERSARARERPNDPSAPVPAALPVEGRSVFELLAASDRPSRGAPGDRSGVRDRGR